MDAGFADLPSSCCSARRKQSCWDQRGEPNGFGEQIEEALVGLPDIGLTQVDPVAAQGLHIYLLQLARPCQEGQMIDQAKIIGARHRVLAGAWKSQGSRIKLLHSGCVAHGAVEGGITCW